MTWLVRKMINSLASRMGNARGGRLTTATAWVRELEVEVEVVAGDFMQALLSTGSPARRPQ
jgi:hypothetical protein